MSHYVIGDIHGCYDEFIKMLNLINYNENDDILIFVGDYIDRGNKSYEMIKWLNNHKSNRVIPIRGNHEEEFILNIDILNSIKNINNNDLYYICNELHKTNKYFDLYGTIRLLIEKYKFSINELNEWRSFFKHMPLIYRKKIGYERYIFVHAGYPRDSLPYEKKKEFILYSRDEAYSEGGSSGTIVISGHTPTISIENNCFTNGEVYEYYNDEIDCVYYNIDCGCVFKDQDEAAQLCCMKIEDKSFYYI